MSTIMASKHLSLPRKRRFCNHCKQFVGYSTFYRCQNTLTWLTDTVVDDDPNSCDENESGGLYDDLKVSKCCCGRNIYTVNL